VDIPKLSYNGKDKSWVMTLVETNTNKVINQPLSTEHIVESPFAATKYDIGNYVALIVNPDEERFDHVTFGVVGTKLGWGGVSIERHFGFAAGDETKTSDLPTDLTATYTGEFYGYASVAEKYPHNTSYADNPEKFGDSFVGAVSGTLDLNVDFTNATVSGEVKDFATDIGFDSNLSKVKLYNGKISGSGFTGLARSVNYDVKQEGFRGNFQGAFYGPNAEEVAGAFSLEGDEAYGYVAAGFGGKR
jgi:hypothetical protein